MKRTKGKLRSLAGAGVLLLCLQLSACSAADEDNAVREEPEYVYKSSCFEIEEEIKGDFTSFEYYDGRLYFLSEYYPDEEQTTLEYYLNIYDINAKGFSSVKIDCTDNAYISSPIFDSDGTGCFLQWEKKDDKRIYTLRTIDRDGSDTGRTDFTEAVTSCIPDCFPSEICLDGSGNICIADYDGVIVADPNGRLVRSMTDISGVQSLVRSGSGEAYVYSYGGDGGYYLRTLNTDEGGEEIPIPVSGYSTDLRIIGGGDNSDFFVSDGSGIISLNTDGSFSHVLDWVESGVSIMEIESIFYIDDGTFLCAGKSYPYGSPKIHILTKQEKTETDKKEIVLAAEEYAINSLIRNAAVRFNNTSDSYFISLKEYADEETDKLRLDMISGDIPDILITGEYTTADSLASKGIFADLYEFIDSDEELSRSDFVPNLLSACETNGRLYRFAESFKIFTALGKTSVFGEDNGITFDRLGEIAASRPEGTEIFAGCSKQDILLYAMEMSGGEFMDLANGECSFDSESFIRLLEFADGFTSEIDMDSYFDDSFWSRFDTMFSDESALLMTAYLTDYGDVYRFEHSNFGERVTAVGFPSDSGSGTSFIVDANISITEKSKVKQGAWEFVRTLLGSEYQDSGGCLPVRKDSLEKMAATAMKPDKNRVNYGIVSFGSMSVSSAADGIGEPSRNDIDRFNNIIASADGLLTYDSTVMDIITEEASSYFSGAKSAKEVAELIQIRVQLYLDETV